VTMPNPRDASRLRARRTSLPGLLATVALVLASLTVAGFLGRWWWVFDLVANLRVQLGGLLIIMTFALVVVGSRGAAAIAGVAAALNLALVVPFLVPTAPEPSVDPGEVLEVTFLNAKFSGADVDAVVAYLQGREDDLVVLAATTQRWVQAFQSADTALTPVMGPDRIPLLELTVLARDPNRVDAEVLQPTDDPRSWLVQIEVEVDGRPVRVLGTHPVSPLTPARAARRDAHLRWMATYLAQEDGPVVVVGDLNATPWSSHHRRLLTEADLIDSQRAHGLQPSWPAPTGPLGLPIDHVLHSDEVTVINRELGPSFGSDHRSVHARLVLRDAAS
jgi:endonuclease/exonuclease/phosphatase (EEP) superfamily protein YafD